MTLSYRHFLLLLTLSALVLSVSGFVLEHVFEAAPCRMCWWQRYVHWVMILGGLMGLVSGHVKRGLIIMMVFSVIGLGAASWQVLVQGGVLPMPAGCAGASGVLTGSAADLANKLASGNLQAPRCDEVNFRILGFSLAAWNIVAMGAMLLIALFGYIKGTGSRT